MNATKTKKAFLFRFVHAHGMTFHILYSFLLLWNLLYKIVANITTYAGIFRTVKQFSTTYRLHKGLLICDMASVNIIFSQENLVTVSF